MWQHVEVEGVDPATEEIRLRISPTLKQQIQLAADSSGVSVSQFMRTAAGVQAELVLAAARLRQVTVVSEFAFEAVMKVLDEPGQADERLIAEARSVRPLDLDR